MECCKLWSEPTGAVQPRGASKTVETREARVGEALAALCSLQGFPKPDYRLKGMP